MEENINNKKGEAPSFTENRKPNTANRAPITILP